MTGLQKSAFLQNRTLIFQSSSGFLQGGEPFRRNLAACMTGKERGPVTRDVISARAGKEQGQSRTFPGRTAAALRCGIGKTEGGMVLPWRLCRRGPDSTGSVTETGRSVPGSA